MSQKIRYTHPMQEPSTKEQVYTLIDVRTPEEFSEQGVEGSINIPLDNLLDSDPQIIKLIDELDKGSEIWLYCLSGARSSIALEILRDMGFTNLVNKRSIFSI